MKTLILHASAGAGHTRAAEALAESFADRFGEGNVIVRDILDFTSRVFKTTYAKGYLNLVRRAPELWGYVYAHSDRVALLPHRQKIRSVFTKLNTRSFNRFYRKLDPDAVICTHFMPLEVVSTMIEDERTSAPLYCAITDFAVHSLWLVQHVRTYFVATEEARRFLDRRGYGPAEVTGIPIHRAFSRSAGRAAARQALGIDPDRSTILILSGGFGVGPTAELVRSFQHTELPLQLIVVAGKNPSLQEKIEVAASHLRIPALVLGFVDNLHEIMDAADMVITKPGGLSTSESLAKNLPLLLLDPIPGQEQRNADFLLEQGAAVRIHDILDAPAKVERLIEDPDRLERIRQNIARVATPHAADAIAARVEESAHRST